MMHDATKRLVDLVLESDAYKWELPLLWRQWDELVVELEKDGTDQTIEKIKKHSKRERDIIVKRFFGAYGLSYDQICEVLSRHRFEAAE